MTTSKLNSNYTQSYGIARMFLLGVIFCILSCNKNEDILENTGTLKGVIGIFEGNCMPMQNTPPCKPSPIVSTVAITKPSEEFIMNLLVDSVTTNAEGEFEISLPEGRYSLFIRDGEKFICESWNYLDGVSTCFPFSIYKDSVTVIQANIDHAVW